MTSTAARTVAMYWHNGRSLGHTVGSAKVAHYLLRSTDPFSIAGITGAYRGLDLLPAEVDLVKIPSFVNRDDPDGWHLRPRLAIDDETLHRARTDLITTFLSHYRPEVLLSNHIPRGADDELVPALESGCARHAVLTLRGVLFDPAKTMRKYFGAKGRGPWLLDNYCQFNVHTSPEIFDLADFYRLPAEMADRMHYTGYLAEPVDYTQEQARVRLGLPADHRLLVVAMGGGQGAGDIWKAVSAALTLHRDMFDQALLVPGPYLEPRDCHELNRYWETDSDVQVRGYEPALEAWMRASDLFIGAAGSNMLGEVLATAANALVIPRQGREIEQEVHAQRLDALGFVRRITLSAALDGALNFAVPQALSDPLTPKAAQLLWDGGSYDRHLPGGPRGTACGCTRTTRSAGQA